MSSSNPLVRILDTYRLTGTNYNWLQNLRIVLNFEKLTHVLDQEAPALPARPSADQQAALEKWMDEDNKAKYYILASMSNDLQQQHEDMRTTREMLVHLQELYGEHSHTARFEISRRLFRVKMCDGQAINDHCLTMIKDIEVLQKLGMNMDKEL